MITREFTKLLVTFKHNGKILLRMSSRLPSSYCAYSNVVVVRPISSEISNDRRSTPIKRNCQSPTNVGLNRRSVVCVSNLFSTRNFLHGKGVHVSSVRHYTDLSEIRVALPSPFANSAARSLAESPPVEFLIDQFTALHNFMGLPWWATIMAIGVLARMTVFPLVVLQQRNVAKLLNLKNELESLQNEVQLKIMDDIERNRLRHDKAQLMFKINMKTEYDKLIIRENCHPLRGHVASFLQLPLWISITFSIRNMTCMAPRFDDAAKQVFDEMAATKFLWITDFVHYDPYFILPVLLGIVNLTNTEIHGLIVPESQITKLMKFFRNFSRVIIIGMVPLISHMPASVVFYWFTSSTCAAVQNLVLLSPKFRRLCRIAHTDMELQKPYSHLIEAIRQKFRRITKGTPLPKPPTRARP